MARELDLMVDELLDDTVRRWMHERDLEPAWRNQCDPAGRRRMRSVCRRSHQLEAQAMRGQPVDAIVLNNRRGACAQLVLAQRLCMGMGGARTGADVRSEFRTFPSRRDSTRPDILPRVMPGTPGPRTVIESKHVHLPSYLVGGRLNAAALRARVQAEIANSARQAADLQSPLRRPGLPPRMRFVFLVGGVNLAAAGRAQLMQQAAREIQQAARQVGRFVFVADADRLRRGTMRNAARLGF